MKFPERVRVATTGVGTGPLTMVAAAVSAEFQTVVAAGLVVGDTFTYSVGLAGSAEWECGVATITTISNGTATFSRTATASSNGNAAVNFSAGTKEVIATPLGATLTKWENGTSRRVVFTSSLCVSDADVSLGSTNMGTDQGAKLQTLLDLAQAGLLHLIWDGAYGVAPQFADIALKVRSNTTISVLPNCGAILRGSAEVALLGNYDRTDGRAGISTNGAGNKNISIIGGMWNGNNVSFRVFQFFGVDQLLLRDNKLFNSHHFHFHCGNVTNVVIDNPYVDKGAGGGIFGDGLHICGPASNIEINNAVILRCGDDNVAFNADDAWVGNTETYQPRGPINNVRLNGLYMESQMYGVRILSGGSAVNNVFIEKVRGTGAGYWLVIDNFIPAQTATTGPGNIGLVVIRDVDVTVAAGGDPNLKACAAIDCKIDRLVMQNIQRASAAGNDYASIRFGPKADIRQLLIDGYMGSVALGGQILFYAGSKVQTAKIVNSTFDSTGAVSGCPIVIQSGASIVQLTGVGNTGVNFTDFVQSSGSVGNMHFPAALNFMDSGTVSGGNAGSTGGASSTFNMEGGFVEQSASALTYSGSLAAINTAIKKASDSFGANIQLSCRIRFTGTAVDALNAALIVRGVSPQPWGNSANGYYLDICAKGAPGFTLKLKTGSTDTTLVGTKGTVAMDTDYDVTLTAKGSAISAKVQRVADGLWLQADGTWAATAATSHSATNTVLGAGTGLPYGLYGYAYNFQGAVSGFTVTNFTAIAAP